MNPITNLINLEKAKLGIIAGGNYTYNILRPDYTQVDNSGTIVGSGCFFVEPSKDNFSEDRLGQVEFFSICGDAYLFQKGDILLCSADDIPPVTVIQRPDSQEFMAFETSKRGYVKDVDNIFTNMYFDYNEAFRPGGEDFTEDLTSYSSPKRQAVMYIRSGIKEGMVFHDTTSGVLWKINLVDNRTFITVLHLSEPNRV